MQDIQKPAKKIFCVGIGGSGMSSLAALLKKSGNIVSGSDSERTPSVIKLEKMGIKVSIGHQEKNLNDDSDMLIYSPAIKRDNPERKKAERMGIKQISYPVALGELTQTKKTIAVCGTHGKTTVTSMVSAILIADGFDPSVIVGSHIAELENNNHRLGKGEWLVIEACEYCRNFLHYNPDAIVLNNVEADHLDYYKNEADYLSAFKDFVFKLSKGGLLVANAEDKNSVEVVNYIRKKRKDVKIVLFGINKGDYTYKKGVLLYSGRRISGLEIKIPGIHNIKNALAAAALTLSLGAKSTVAAAALHSYAGAARRFELKGFTGKTAVYDDYAHHPTEIEATLDAARQMYKRPLKILAVFQPHQYSRTYKLKNEFSTAFKKADLTIVADIFHTRDSRSATKKINSEKLVALINKAGTKALYGQTPEETLRLARNRKKDFDVIIVMGAGDINKIIPKLLTKKT